METTLLRSKNSNSLPNFSIHESIIFRKVILKERKRYKRRRERNISQQLDSHMTEPKGSGKDDEETDRKCNEIGSCFCDCLAFICAAVLCNMCDFICEMCND